MSTAFKKQASRGLVDPNPDWPRQAACAGMDTEWWFDGDTSQGKAVCRRCPVESDCLSWALANPSLQGVLGGRSEEERKRLRASAETAPTAALCRRGHVIGPAGLRSNGRCRSCDDEDREAELEAKGVWLVPCVCGRRVAPQHGVVPRHVDRATDSQCEGSGRSA